MFMRIAIILLVLVAVVLLTPLVFSAVKKTKSEYEELTGDSEDCDHTYFPKYDETGLIGQECSMCHRFNSLADLGLARTKGEEDDNTGQ